MSKYSHTDGLYRKVESPVVESVRHTEGLYRKTKVAKVELPEPSEQVEQTVKEMEANQQTSTKKILNS